MVINSDRLFWGWKCWHIRKKYTLKISHFQEKVVLKETIFFFFFFPGKSFNQGRSEWLKNETLILDCVMVHCFLNLFYKIACVLLGCLAHADQAMSPPCCGRKAGLPPWVRCELVVKAAWDIAPGLCSSRGHGAVTIMVGHIYNLRRNWGVNQSVVKADDVFLKQLRKRSVGANRWCCSYNSAA